MLALSQDPAITSFQLLKTVVWSRIYAVAAINEGSAVDLKSYIRGKMA
jgi:hypothetical protein